MKGKNVGVNIYNLCITKCELTDHIIFIINVLVVVNLWRLKNLGISTSQTLLAKIDYIINCNKLLPRYKKTLIRNKSDETEKT